MAMNNSRQQWCWQGQIQFIIYVNLPRRLSVLSAYPSTPRHTNLPLPLSVCLPVQSPRKAQSAETKNRKQAILWYFTPRELKLNIERSGVKGFSAAGYQAKLKIVSVNGYVQLVIYLVSGLTTALVNNGFLCAVSGECEWLLGFSERHMCKPGTM